MKITTDTETRKRAQKMFASTLAHLDTILIRGKTVNISKETINRMLHDPKYT